MGDYPISGELLVILNLCGYNHTFALSSPLFQQSQVKLKKKQLKKWMSFLKHTWG